jgi:hypothetical protein
MTDQDYKGTDPVAETITLIIFFTIIVICYYAC